MDRIIANKIIKALKETVCDYGKFKINGYMTIVVNPDGAVFASLDYSFEVYDIEQILTYRKERDYKCSGSIIDHIIHDIENWYKNYIIENDYYI